MGRPNISSSNTHVRSDNLKLILTFIFIRPICIIFFSFPVSDDRSSAHDALLTSNDTTFILHSRLPKFPFKLAN